MIRLEASLEGSSNTALIKEAEAVSLIRSNSYCSLYGEVLVL